MQAYHNGERVYGYGGKGQPYAPPPQYYQQYPGYGYAQTGGAPIAAPFPMYPGGIQPSPAPGRPRPLDREPSRSSTPGHARPGMKPLKSALKRTRTPDHGGPVGEAPPLVRGRTPDNVSIQRQRTRSGSRMRANSSPRWESDHLIVSLRSTNELQVEGINDAEIANELSEDILSIWPHGVNQHGYRRGKWKVQFAGSPWSSVGLDAILAGKMLIRLSVCLARVGYSYSSTINVGSPWSSPQLVYHATPPDEEAFAFAMMISKSGGRLTFLDGPPDLTTALGTALREFFPRKVTTDRATEDGLHIFEIKRGTTGVLVERNTLTTFVLTWLNRAGFRLCGSVPLGSRSLFSLGQRRELWLFRIKRTRSKDPNRRPSSRQSRQSRGEYDA
ncbi:hypothetical protein L226DRAFT_528678 [Lentinus tigrinus ALCF2SS1-7]|uniref:uncharacterized protein n=1 Tax=Lentinus tigrinus ALCF2SS1-7 TaxID=1328758 RepID=UPI001165E109|nr:hypothetical protein L226DRAFT_528678 [Lentinus tigrinus ALCF2SS1-7]